MRAVRKSEAEHIQPAPTRARRKPKAAQADATPADSPALALQADLSARWEMDTDAYDGPRWSPRRMLAVTGGVSLALWVVIGLTLRAVFTG